MARADDEAIRLRILQSLRRIIRRTSEYSRSLGRQSGITVPQMLCLKAIAESAEDGGATVAGVADEVQLSAPTVSRLLDRLEREGFVTRGRDDVDRRKVHLQLTREGARRVKNLPAPLHEVFLERLGALSRSERTELLSALERIVDLMDAEQIDAAPLLTPELDVDSAAAPVASSSRRDRPSKRAGSNSRQRSAKRGSKSSD